MFIFIVKLINEKTRKSKNPLPLRALGNFPYPVLIVNYRCYHLKQVSKLRNNLFVLHFQCPLVFGCPLSIVGFIMRAHMNNLILLLRVPGARPDITVYKPWALGRSRRLHSDVSKHAYFYGYRKKYDTKSLKCTYLLCL